MNQISIALLATTLLCASPAMAGAGHEHGPGGSHTLGPISSEAAIKKAEQQVKSLVKSGKIDTSWAGVKAASATLKTFAQGDEWVVMFKNAKISNSAEQTLYVFYTLNGSYIASNFTGN